MLKKHIIGIGAGIIAIVIALIIVGFHALGLHIYDRTDCERFNIDNNELRTGIGIPSVLDAKCASNGKIKKSIFTIDTNKVNINRYIERNHFDKVDSIYINIGEDKNTKWIATLNRESATLNIRIEYKDSYISILEERF